MKVSELGQFGLIDMLAKMIRESRDNRINSWSNLLDGIGDDCAVWKGNSSNQLAKVDCQVEGVHFTFDIITWEELGWKSLAVNLSDIASMGGIPGYALVSLGLPLNTEVENVLKFYEGLLKLAKQSGTAVVGGNTSSSPNVFIDIVVFGQTTQSEGKYLTRSSAKPGDKIAVTGWLGTSAAGLKMLTESLKFDPHTMNCLRQAFTQPEPRLKEGLLLINNGVQTGIDISDGLLSDLGHVCKASKVEAVIQTDRLPILSEVKKAFGDHSIQMALSGGEDYQLLFTAKTEIVETISRTSSYPITIIGEIKTGEAGKITVLNEKGISIKSSQSGWDHFKRELE
jgi:thiamine-monophosphate kinase